MQSSDAKMESDPILVLRYVASDGIDATQGSASLCEPALSHKEVFRRITTLHAYLIYLFTCIHSKTIGQSSNSISIIVGQSFAAHTLLIINYKVNFHGLPFTSSKVIISIFHEFSFILSNKFWYFIQVIFMP